MNAAGQVVCSSDSEQHRSDGNVSDRSMLNLNEDLKPIGYYIKDRERMLQEMFRCVRGYKLQAILPDVLKVTSGKCFLWLYDDHDEYDAKKLLRKQISVYLFLFFFTIFFWSHFNTHNQVRLIIDPYFR